MRRLFTVYIKDDNSYDIDIEIPKTESDFEALTQAAAKLPTMVASVGASSTPWVCHAKCCFAGIVDLMHKIFHDEDKAGYHELIRDGRIAAGRLSGGTTEH